MVRDGLRKASEIVLETLEGQAKPVASLRLAGPHSHCGRPGPHAYMMIVRIRSTVTATAAWVTRGR